MIKELFFNDAQLWPVYLLIFLMSLLVLLVSIYFHELGHQLYFKLKHKKNIKVRFVNNGIWKMKWLAGEQADYDALTDKQYKDVNLWGILFGLIPILIAGAFYQIFFLVSIGYIAGVWGDLKEMTKKVKLEE